jgi:UDP-galactose transporter B1
MTFDQRPDLQHANIIITNWQSIIRSIIEFQMLRKLATHEISKDRSDEETVAFMEAGQASSALPKISNDTLKLLFCCTGIYSAYLIFGSLQEDIFTYSSDIISTFGPVAFSYIWFVQVSEALTNTIFSYIGLLMTRSKEERYKPRPNQKFFFMSGFSQVSSKALTSLSLNSGLSFPLATMAKSGKMAPVMIGQLVISGTRYNLREYAQVSAIVAGTALLGLSKSKGAEGMAHSSSLGVILIIGSLVMDGVTGGIQKRLKVESQEVGHSLKGYEFMFYTNMYMFWVALCVANFNGDLIHGIRYCLGDPHICSLILKFCVCSAVGQSFIFYTIATFDPLVCSTITTTRKIVSVFFSIFYKGHAMNNQAWLGVFIACLGILSELQGKVGRKGLSEGKRHKIAPSV